MLLLTFVGGLGAGFYVVEIDLGIYRVRYYLMKQRRISDYGAERFDSFPSQLERKEYEYW